MKKFNISVLEDRSDFFKSLIILFLKSWTIVLNRKLSALSVKVNPYPFFEQTKKLMMRSYFFVFFFNRFLSQCSVLVFTLLTIFGLQFICLFLEEPNQEKKFSVYIILKICLPLFSPLTINKLL